MRCEDEPAAGAHDPSIGTLDCLGPFPFLVFFKVP